MTEEQLVALAAELIAGHPVTGAYNADDALAADQINELDIVRIKEFMSGSEMWANTDTVEFSTLTDVNKQLWVAFCAIDEHSPENNGLAHKYVNLIFGTGSDTLTTLAAARSETVSQAAVLGFGLVTIGNIQNARNI